MSGTTFFKEYQSLVLLVLSLVISSSVIILSWYKRRPPLLLPPGPKPMPLLGNLFDFPTERGGQVFHEWAKKYNSDLIFLNAAGTPLLILDSYEASVDLLEKRSAIYSSRGHLTMLGEVMGFLEWVLVILPYGDAWRVRRKLFHQTLHEGATKLFQPQQLKNTAKLLSKCLAQPEDFSDHTKHLIASTVLFIAYGLDIDETDPLLTLNRYVTDAVIRGTSPGRYLVDVFPFLKYLPRWFPGASFKQEGIAVRKAWKDMLEIPLQTTKAMMKNGTAEPSFVSLALGEISDATADKQFEAEVSEVAGVMFLAGTDTTDALIESVVRVLILFPDIQRKAQEEIDRVVGAGNLPSFEDEASLPYVTAILLETMRFNPVLPIGVAHLSQEVDTYRGYHIPKNTLVVGNAWGMLHAEDKFPEPNKFNPDRFLKNAVLNPDVPDPRKVIFGFGRRICPGRHLALSTSWIVLAQLLAAFDISPSNQHPHPDPQAIFDESSTIRHPLPFSCSFKPRSQKIVELIQTSGLM